MSSTYAGVVRVSFVGGRKGDRFHADEEQVADIERAVAGIRGAQLDLLAPELDVSGGLPLEQRPSLLAAVEGVERGDYAGVVVSYLSRLGRSVREQLRAWDRVEKAGGRIIVVREGIDTSTPSGRLQRTMLLAIAEHEREVAAERFEDRARLATQAGVWQRRQTPLGYVRDAKTRRLVPDERADDVRWAFSARATGTPLVRISDRLGMTPGGARFLLRNRVYLGELRVRSFVNAAAHPPLVSVEQFEAAQVTVPRPGRNDRGEPALLAGLVRCQACGHVMSRKRTAATVYACDGRSSAGQCPAPASVTTHLLDGLVERLALRELQELAVTAADGVPDMDAAHAVLAAAEGELAAYLTAVSAADVGVEAFSAGARLRREKVDAARDELRRELAVRPILPNYSAGDEAWDSLDVHEHNRLLRSMLEAVVVRRAGGRGARVPLRARVRVFAYGTGLDLPRRSSEHAAGIRPLPFPDLDDEADTRVLGAEDAREFATGVEQVDGRAVA